MLHDELFGKLRVVPNARDLAHLTGDLIRHDEHALTVLNVVEELADVHAAVRVHLLAMPIARAVLEVARDLGAVIELIRSVARHG